MFKLRNHIWVAVVPVMMLAASGCATKKYVSQQVNPVNTRVSSLEMKTKEEISFLNNKEQRDISQVNERIATTDQRVDRVASAVQQAQGTASRAMDEASANSAKTAANSTAITSLRDGVANSLNYQLVEKGDVTFGVDQATLNPQSKAALDAIVIKVQSLPRAVIELAGFTDKAGSKNYNYALSRRRAEAVQRYLVMQKVPVRDIVIVGLGEEAPPEGLTSDLEMVNPNPSRAELNRLSRRVHIRVFGAGDIAQGTASRSAQ